MNHKGRNIERVGLRLLGTLFTRCSDGIPNVPLVKANLLSLACGRHLVLNAGQVDKATSDLNGALGGSGCCAGEGRQRQLSIL